MTLAWLVRHPCWDCIGLPLRALLYVRQKDLPKLPRRTRVPFRTKLEMGAELIDWLVERLQWLGKTIRFHVKTGSSRAAGSGGTALDPDPFGPSQDKPYEDDPTETACVGHSSN